MIETELHTIFAGQFNATCDTFAYSRNGLWFLSLVGGQAALKAAFAALVHTPPSPVEIYEGIEEASFSTPVFRGWIAEGTKKTWESKLQKLPAGQGWHSLMYTKLAHHKFDRQDFLLLVRPEDNAPSLYYRFLDQRLPLPIHHTWADWLWEKGLNGIEETITKLESRGSVQAFYCQPDILLLKQQIIDGIQTGELTVQEEVQ